MEAYFMGIDAGTQGVRVVVSDPEGSARRSSLKRTGTSQLNHCLL